MILSDWLTVLRLRFGFVRRRLTRLQLQTRRRPRSYGAEDAPRLHSLEALEPRIMLTAPTGIDDFFFTQQSTQLTVSSPGVLENDSDAESDPLSAFEVTGPSNGSLMLNQDGSFTYTPTTGFSGTDSFSYEASDGMESSAVVTVTLDVGDVAGDWLGGERVVNFGSAATVDLGGLVGDGSNGTTDVDLFRVSLTAGQTLTIDIDAAQLDDGSTLSTLDSHLRVFDEFGMEMATNADGIDPDTGLSSSDSFLSFTASMDGVYVIGVSGAGNEFYDPYMPGMGSSGSTGEYRLRLNLSGGAPANTPPEFDQASYTFSVNADASSGELVGTLSASDLDNDMFWFSDDGMAWPFEVDSMSGEVRYADMGGLMAGQSYSFTAMVNDNYGSDSATVTINVVAPNNTPPVFDQPSYTFSVNADATSGELVGTLSASDLDNDMFWFSDDGMAWPFQVDSMSGEVRYADMGGLSAGQSYSFTAMVNDNYGSDSATVTINVVAPNNTPPEFDQPSYTFTVDADASSGELVGTLSASDLDNDMFWFSDDGMAWPFQVDSMSGEVRYADMGGLSPGQSYSFTAMVNDNYGSDSATVTINVAAPNQPPIANADTVTTAYETSVLVDVLANDSDPELGALTLVSVGTSPDGQTVIEAGKVRFTPNTAFAGDASFTYVVRDPEGNTSTGQVTVTVANNPPTAVDDEAVTNTQTEININVLINDSDPEGSSLTLLSVTQPTHGSVAIVDGQAVYTPDGIFLGDETFTYTIEDPAGASAMATVTVTVAPVALTAVNDDLNVVQDIATDLDVLANDLVPLGAVLNLSIVTDPANGILTVDGLEVLYTPNTGYAGTDTFTYRITDGNGGDSTATVTLTIMPNEPPVAMDDEFEIEGGAGVVLDVLGNDSDPEAGELTIISAESLWWGTVTIDPGENGAADRLIYDSPSDTYGIDTLTYTIADEWGRTASATVTLWINPRPVPQFATLNLLNDTGHIGDLVTTDATVAGTVTTPHEVEGLLVEVDYTADGVADASVGVDAFDGMFSFDFGPHLVFGEVLVSLRAVELNAQGQPITAGDWRDFEFTFVETDADDDPPNEDDPGAALLTNVTVEVATAALVRLVGTVSDQNGGTVPEVEFDLDHDGVADAMTSTSNSDFIKEFTTEVGYGEEVALRVRTKDIDDVTGTPLYGAWQTIGFSRDYPANEPAAITQVALANDTDTAGDGITSDATITGSISHADGPLEGQIVEYDLTGDDIYEGTVTTDVAGQFTIDLNSASIPDGSNTLKVRTREWDAAREEQLYSEWSTLTFEYTGNAARLPSLTGVALANDTGTAGDGVTSDATLEGTFISGSAVLTQTAVEIDWNGDGQADNRYTEIDPATGEFLIDLNPELSLSGPMTFALRAWGWDASAEGVLAGEWEEFTFTYDAPPPPKVEVTDLGLANDTGTLGDGVTYDPSVEGRLTHASESISGAAVQYDLDGDGAFDGETSADHRGRFTIDLTEASLALGSVTVSVRGGVWSPAILGYDFGDWESLTFTLEAVPAPETPVVGNLTLMDDDDGDLTVTRAVFSGTVSDANSEVRLVRVQFDVNGDGEAEGDVHTDTLGSGQFLVDVSPFLESDGSKTVRFRALDPDLPDETFGDWTSFTFTYDAPDPEDNPQDELIDEDDVPFTPTELDHVDFEAGDLAIGITADTADTTQAGTFSASYIDQGSVVGTSDLLASIPDASINNDDPTNDTSTNNDGAGNITDITHTGTSIQTVTAITDPVTGEWYRYENIVTTYDIVTTYTAADGSGYDFHQWGTYGYTLIAYGYNGNSVYTLTEYRTDNFINEQWSGSDPTDIYVITGSQSYNVDSGGYVKVNDDGLAAPGSTASWIGTVDTVNPTIDGTNSSAILHGRPIVTYGGSGYGRMEYSDYSSTGTVDHNGDFSDTWSQWYYTLEETPAGFGTTVSEEFEYQSVHVDPYDITNDVDINTTTNVGGVTKTLFVDDTTNLKGATTTAYDSEGVRTTYADGTWESVVKHTTTRELHDVYTHTGFRTYTLTDNSDPNATVNLSSTSKSNATRNRDSVQVHGTTTTRLVDGTQTVAGTVNGTMDSKYNFSTSVTMNSDGTSDDGTTTMSFLTTSTSNSSGDGTYKTTSIGTFGTAGTNITNTYNSMETGSSDWDYTANSKRNSLTDDGAGNSSNTGGTSSSTNNGQTSYTNTVSVTEQVTGAVVTSTGTMTHTGSGSGSNSYDQTDFSITNSKTDTPEFYSTSFNDSSSYSNGKSTWNSTSTGNGTITNGEVDYTQTITETSNGSFASGHANTFSSYTEEDDGFRFESHDSSGNSKFDETGTFNASSTDTTHISPAGNNSSSKSTYNKEGSTTWSSDSNTTTVIFEDYSSEDFPGSGTYVSWHDELHTSGTIDTGSGKYSESSQSQSNTAADGTTTTSGSSTYESSGNGTITSNGSSTITDYSHSDNNGVSSTSDSTSTVTRNGTTTYENKASGTASELNGVVTSLDTSSSKSDTVSTTKTKTDRVQDNLDTNNDDKITSKSHSESHATNDASSTLHSEATSSEQLFGDGTKATAQTSLNTDDSSSTFTSNNSGNSERNVNGLNGITSKVTKVSSSDTTGDSSVYSESSTSHNTFADGTWSSSSTSFGDSEVNTTSNSSSTNDSTSTDESTDVTKTVTTHGHHATTNAKQTITTDWFNHSTNGSAGGTTESWNDETITGSGTVVADSHSTVRAQKDLENFHQVYNESKSNGSYTVNGSSKNDRFPDGKTSSSSTYNRTENGTSSRKEETTGKSKNVSHPQPGLTKTDTSDLTDTTSWTDIIYTTIETVNTNDPVDGPYTSTETSSHSESGKQTWNYSETTGSTLTGTVNLPGDDSDGTTFNNSSSSTTKENGSADFSQSDSTTVTTTDGAAGLQEKVTSKGSSSLNGDSTLTITDTGSGSITQNRKIGDTQVNFSQTSSHNAKSTIVTNIDDSYSYETNGEGGTKSTSNSNPDINGTSTSTTTETTQVTMTKSGYNFTKTEQDIDKSSSTFNANLSHTIETDFAGTTTHSGGGSSDTKSQSRNEHYYDSTTYEKKTALISTWKGYYYQLVTNDREDITKEKSQGNATVVFEADGTETWGGSQTNEHDIKRDYKKSTITISSISKSKTDQDFDGYQEDHTEYKGSKKEEHTREANRGKTEHQLKSDGSLDEGKDVLGSSVKAVEIEKHQKDGSSTYQTWVENSTPSAGTTVYEKWTQENIQEGEDQGYIYWSTKDSFYREYFDKSDVNENTSTYEYERNVNTATTTSTETKNSYSTSSGGDSQSKIITPGPTGTPITEQWSQSFNESHSEFHHASNGTSKNTWQGETTPYHGTIFLEGKSEYTWDWNYDRVEKWKSTESQKREAGSDTAKAKVDREWELTVDFTGTWDWEENINSTGATDGSTMSVTNKTHEEVTLDGDAKITFNAEYDISGLNDESTPPVVTPVGNPEPVIDWTWVEDWGVSLSSSGSANIVKYMPHYEGPEMTEVWESKSFGGSFSFSETYNFTASDDVPDGKGTTTPGTDTSNMDNADFLSGFMFAMPGIYMSGMPYSNNSEPADLQSFQSWIGMGEMIVHMETYNFELFDSLNPSWIESLVIGISDAFQQNFPELANFLSSTWDYAWAFGGDLFQQFDDGTMHDRAFGLIDGFLNGINPFDHWISIPDIGPVFGHVEDYAFAKTVGTFAGIGTSIAISFMGPGLVQCGTLAHKALVVWEAAGAVGSIGGAVTNIYNNGGQVGVMDVLGIVGGIASIGSIKGLMNKCFVGDTLVVYGKEDVQVATTFEAQAAGPDNLTSLIFGGGLLLGAGVGWFIATRNRPEEQTSRQLRRRKASVLDLFGDAEFLDHLWLPPGTKRPLPAFALAGTGTLPARASRRKPLPVEREFAVTRCEPLPSTEQKPPCPDGPSEAMPALEQVSPKQTRPARTASRSLGWLVKLICLLGVGLCCWSILPSFFADAPHATAEASEAPGTGQKLLTRQIQDIRPGMRVLADNPELAGQSVEPLEIQPKDWRLVTLEMPKADGSILFMEFLWDRHELGGRDIGEEVPINLPELGISGSAAITSIKPCPELERGSGRIVTGTFRHSNATVLDLQVASETTPFGTTPNHPFWSEDRQDWIQAGQLIPGECLRLQSQMLTRVVSLTPREGRHEVYNLEVEGHHTYHIGESGVLVHNSQDYLDPKLIHWSQNSVGPKSKDGFEVVQTAEDLKNGVLKIDKLPTIRVWKDDAGKIWTLDNRRLTSFRLAELDKVPVRFVSRKVAMRELFGKRPKMTTVTEGLSILIREINRTVN